MTGRLSVRWKNNPAPAATRQYHLTFSPYVGGTNGAQGSKDVVSQDDLRNYLIAIQVEAMTVDIRQQADAWLLELHTTENLVLPNAELTEEQAKEYQRKN